MENLEAYLEGLLFVVGEEGIAAQQLSEVLNQPQEVIDNALQALQKRCLNDDRGIEVVFYGGVVKLVAKAMIHPYADHLFQGLEFYNLSNAALETLAIIAYKQPITRVEIEEIRGVGSDMMLRKLLARDLICETGRSDAPGRPILYGVTQNFMDSFKLVSLEELPKLPALEESDGDDLFATVAQEE